MNVTHTIHDGLNIVCKDTTNTYEIKECSGYDESIDEIKIRTVVKNNELKRGWIGDLSYKTRNSRELVDCNNYTDSFAEDIYKDVLLKSVNIWSMEDEIITWEYTFLKK